VHLAFTAVLLTASAAVLRRVARKAGGQSSTESSDSTAPPLPTPAKRAVAFAWA